jgi:hypothetical protein
MFGALIALDWYAIAKDLAGPIATVIAAATVATITYKFAKIQAEIAKSQRDIAKSQRDIAYDKLKADLFGKRYEIYSTAHELIDLINTLPFDRPTGGEKIVGMMRKLDEARFFFPHETAVVFATIGKFVEMHEVELSRRNLNQDNEAVRSLSGENAALASKTLRDIRVQLPSLMSIELGFSQLTIGK